MKPFKGMSTFRGQPRACHAGCPGLAFTLKTEKMSPHLPTDFINHLFWQNGKTWCRSCQNNGPGLQGGLPATTPRDVLLQRAEAPTVTPQWATQAHSRHLLPCLHFPRLLQRTSITHIVMKRPNKKFYLDVDFPHRLQAAGPRRWTGQVGELRVRPKAALGRQGRGGQARMGPGTGTPWWSSPA